MAESQNAAALPNPDQVPAAEGNNANPHSAPATRAQHKRNPRHRKSHSHSMPQIDGTVSDSVNNNTMASPRSNKAPKPRHQSVAVGAIPKENGNVGNKPAAPKQRPTSVGGNMAPATPFKEPAYAGPTFQASPAPSSLPVPKFFSKSVPNVAAQPSLEARMAGEKTPEAEHSSPESDVVSPSRGANQSPLDIFFKADKAEKERSKSGGMLSPEMAARQPPPATEPRNPFQQSGKSIFLREMDGDDGAMPSPKTVPHDQRRPPIPRANSTPGSRGAETNSESEREAYTKSLKDLLFTNVNAVPRQNSTPPNNQRANSSAPVNGNAFETPSPFQRSSSGPSTPTPTPTANQQNHYSLHYGNRNLSPLFKAARYDTPARPSHLRKGESASDVVPNASSTTEMPTRSGDREIPQIDPDSFSRDFLNQHIRASQPTTLPNLPFTRQTAPISRPTSGLPSASVPQQGVPVGGNSGSGASPRTSTAANDIKTMEDDLRRMLKLNVLSN